MSAQPRPRRRPVVRNTRTGSDSLRNTLPGVALVLASVLPSALAPPPSGQPTTVERTEPAAPTRRADTRRASTAFNPTCELPFDDIKTEGLAVDSVCSEDGNAGDDEGKRLEINAKNNFCADGDPVPISYDDFKSLQAASDNVGGLKKTLKTTREPLLNILSSPGRPAIGEGSVVQFVAFVLDAHHSNVGKGKGELVNCKLPDREDNDIHIELVIDPSDDDPCNSVTTEMSPHFRPEAWEELVDLKIERPVRITGPLFFDGSHQPCRDGKRPNPKRISVWEIHPTYQFEVCKNKTLVACDVRNHSQWIPLDQWQSMDEVVEP